MDLIFDKHAARLYRFWCQSPQGRAMERSAERLILQLLDPRPGERVLDIGCGYGNQLLFFSKLGLDINGVDASPHMINKARERLGNRCSLKTGMAQDLPYDDNEFDFAVLINTLEFLDDPLQALREAGRVAKRKVFVGVMNSLSWHCVRSKLQSLFHESLFAHVRFYTLWDLKSYVQRAYGQIPVVWCCEQIWPGFLERFGRKFLTDLLNMQGSPFGFFLGLSATILYRMKTDNLHLKIGIKKAGQSIASEVTMDNLNRRGGAQGNERSLFV